MILSWLQNHLEILGGRAAWSWHFSCVQTVVKLQLHSVLATLCLLAEERLFSTSPLPHWEMWEGSLAAFAEVASVPSFSKWICSQPLVSSLSCLATGQGKGTIAFLVFLCLKTRLLLTCASSSTDFFFSSSFSKVGWFTKSSERLHYTQFIVQRGGKRSDEWAWRRFLLCPLEEKQKDWEWYLCTVGVCLDYLTIHGHCKGESENLHHSCAQSKDSHCQ